MDQTLGRLEVPHQVGLDERGDHAAGRAVHVDADGQLRRVLGCSFGQAASMPLHVVVACRCR